MTADEMLTELARALEKPLENQAQWHALVLRLEAWRAEARIAGHNSAVEAMQAQVEDAVAAEREACVKVAEESRQVAEGTCADSAAERWFKMAGLEVAAAIRARK